MLNCMVSGNVTCMCASSWLSQACSEVRILPTYSAKSSVRGRSLFYPMGWHGMPLDLPSLITYHMKYRSPDCGIPEHSHIRIELLMKKADDSALVI